MYSLTHVFFYILHNTQFKGIIHINITHTHIHKNTFLFYILFLYKTIPLISSQHSTHTKQYTYTNILQHLNNNNNTRYMLKINVKRKSKKKTVLEKKRKNFENSHTAAKN